MVVRDGIGSRSDSHGKICGGDMTRVSKIVSTTNVLSIEIYSQCECDERRYRANWRVATAGITSIQSIYLLMIFKKYQVKKLYEN